MLNTFIFLDKRSTAIHVPRLYGVVNRRSGQISDHQKLIRSLADIAVHISQEKAAGNFFLKRAKEYFFVSGPSN